MLANVGKRDRGALEGQFTAIDRVVRAVRPLDVLFDYRSTRAWPYSQGHGSTRAD